MEYKILALGIVLLLISARQLVTGRAHVRRSVVTREENEAVFFFVWFTATLAGASMVAIALGLILGDQ